MKFVDVAINHKGLPLQTTFTYKVKEEFVGSVKIGQRILVPFGIKNKSTEAVVLNIKDECDYIVKRVKYVKDILEEEPSISNNMIKLSYWMANRYMAGYDEVIRTMLPTGTNIKSKMYYKLVDDIFDSKNLSKDEILIINLLSTEKELEVKEIDKRLKIKNLNIKLNKMKEKGLILSEEKVNRDISKKYKKRVKVKFEESLDEILEVISKRALRQRQIIEVLYEKKEMDVKEVLEETGGTLSTLKVLEEKQLLEIFEVEENRMIFKEFERYEKFELNDEQKKAYTKILEDISMGEIETLIHGVTGSGKTEIYMWVIEEVIKRGKQCIVLVPEISLTPQTLNRFIGRFGERVAVLHSRLSLGERYDEWRRIKEGNVDIIIGARSAVFAPVKNLGLIVIDEEHESSYKSGMSPRYDTIEVARKRCELEKAHLILGSATPSMESYQKAKDGEISLITLENRANKKEMPDVEIVDMRVELENGNKSVLSRALYEAIKENLKDKKQTILFLNRRGHSSFVSCRKCGYVVKCRDCEISMTYHGVENMLKCHYCGRAEKVPVKCPDCGSKYIKYFGAGTQKIEAFVKNIFKEASVERMDVDTTSKKGSHEEILKRFGDGKTDILIGTQMIAKGLDFPNVTLVGVLSADTSLNLPDFRASERTFQLLTQVAGRAGRGEHSGKVIIQTYEPDHYSIETAIMHDYKKFYNLEINMRKIFDYPPFTSIINIVVSSEHELKSKKIAENIYLKTIKVLNNNLNDFSKEFITKPGPCPIKKVRNSFRYNFVIKVLNKDLNLAIEELTQVYIEVKKEIKDSARVIFDVNPVSIL